MTNYKSITYLFLAMFAFAMMALFTREDNVDVLTMSTWSTILVVVLFGIGISTQGELRLSAQNVDDADNKGEKLGITY